jgi:hypothetical protein
MFQGLSGMRWPHSSSTAYEHCRRHSLSNAACIDFVSLFVLVSIDSSIVYTFTTTCSMVSTLHVFVCPIPSIPFVSFLLPFVFLPHDHVTSDQVMQCIALSTTTPSRCSVLCMMIVVLILLLHLSIQEKIASISFQLFHIIPLSISIEDKNRYSEGDWCGVSRWCYNR